MVDDVTGVDQVAVDLAGHGVLGKARAHRRGDVHDGDGFVKLAAAAVWERDVDHWEAGIGGWGFGIRKSQSGRGSRSRFAATKKAPRGRLSVASGTISAGGGGSAHVARSAGVSAGHRSEEHTSELQSLMRISYAVFCLKKKQTHN